jgi:hypothetical protein
MGVFMAPNGVWYDWSFKIGLKMELMLMKNWLENYPLQLYQKQCMNKGGSMQKWDWFTN